MDETVGDLGRADTPETTGTVALPREWNRAELKRLGFTGFVSLIGMDRSVLPREHGVYVVLHESGERPRFLATNVVTKRLPYDPAQLEKKWLTGRSVVYIGKAEGIRGLHARVGAFSRQAENHSGGRALWQLDSAADLLVAWLETPGVSALKVEQTYLQAFKAEHGGYPFANRRG
ncbi:hypothetical protein ACPEEZ_06115 [Frigoribacterium sp. 2-23]|uniref:hypothetical protein n=1 Tax=Frigoribacterium sp. 2-23 TaxID=3415006 RepID=UPI003C704813